MSHVIQIYDWGRIFKQFVFLTISLYILSVPWDWAEFKSDLPSIHKKTSVTQKYGTLLTHQTCTAKWNTI